MGDIENRTLLYAKGGLMLAVGFLASALLIARHPDVYTVSLLAVAAWLRAEDEEGELLCRQADVIDVEEAAIGVAPQCLRDRGCVEPELHTYMLARCRLGVKTTGGDVRNLHS
jgi:hypothetical protein